MIKLAHTDVVGWEHAIRGMRNPLESWDKSDSYWDYKQRNIDDLKVDYQLDEAFYLGINDRNLMMRLRNAGTDHRKFMRMIVVYVDILAPLYWWKEFDTYKVGTVRNSCSTMHCIHKHKFDLNDFSCEDLLPNAEDALCHTITTLNFYRDEYLNSKDKQYWRQMIQLLPDTYNQRATVMLNYEVLANIYKSRKDHKLDEWHDFCDWIRELPYSELITGED